MAKLQRVVGSTSHILEIFAQDSSSTTGAGLPGLAYNTASLTCYYKRNTGSASVAITLADVTTLGTFVSGGFKAVDGTHMPGLYEFHPPDAAFLSGAKSVVFMLKGATNLAPVLVEVELTAVDNQATSFGLSLAKNTNITGFNDIAATAVVSSGAITTSGGAVSTVTAVGTTTTTTNLTNLPTMPTDWLTAAGLSAAAVTEIQAGLSTHSAADVWAVTTRTITGGTIATYTGNTPQTGDAFARLGAPTGDSIAADIATRSTYAGVDTSGTATLLARVTAQRATNLDSLDAAVSSRSSHSAAAVWAVGARTLTAFGFSVTVGANADKTGYSLTAAYDAAKTAAQPSDVSGGGGGSGAPGQVLVDHAFGATSGDPEPLAWADAGSGAGIADAQILAYPAADYDAGRRGRSFLVGLTTTDLEGRWAAPIFLDPGAAYVLVYVNRGRYRPRVVRVAVP